MPSKQVLTARLLNPNPQRLRRLHLPGFVFGSVHNYFKDKKRPGDSYSGSGKLCSYTISNLFGSASVHFLRRHNKPPQKALSRKQFEYLPEFQIAAKPSEKKPADGNPSRPSRGLRKNHGETICVEVSLRRFALFEQRI